MARYNLVKIGSLYLTSDGLVGGTKCKTKIEGLSQFATSRTGQVQISADGTPYAQLIDVSHRGLVITITTDFMAQSVYNSLKAIFEAAKNDEETFEVQINGDTGNHTFDCIPRVPDDIFFDSFSNTIIKGAGCRMITT